MHYKRRGKVGKFDEMFILRGELLVLLVLLQCIPWQRVGAIEGRERGGKNLLAGSGYIPRTTDAYWCAGAILSNKDLCSAERCLVEDNKCENLPATALVSSALLLPVILAMRRSHVQGHN